MEERSCVRGERRAPHLLPDGPGDVRDERLGFVDDEHGRVELGGHRWRGRRDGNDHRELVRLRLRGRGRDLVVGRRERIGLHDEFERERVRVVVELVEHRLGRADHRPASDLRRLVR